MEQVSDTPEQVSIRVTAMVQDATTIDVEMLPFVTGAEISTEPSYILLNTAVSSQWGFPLECPDNCKCKEYDCHSNDYAQRCGFSEGFCEMMTRRDSPQYKINWVRVYQDLNKPEQKVGCSTPERPTRRYIEAHEKLYKSESDDRPLKSIQIGRGACDPRAEGASPESCGGEERGICTKGKVCECNKGWVGPHCLAPEGFDDVVWDQPDKLSDVGFVPPRLTSTGLFIGLSILAIMLIFTMQCRRKMEGWKPIPDAAP
jgi:hypothetical protein